MYNSQYYTCEQIDERLLQGYLDDYNTQNNTNLTKAQFLSKLGDIFANWKGLDDEPVAGSDNLVKSGGVVASIITSEKKSKVITFEQGALNTNGTVESQYKNRIASEFVELHNPCFIIKLKDDYIIRQVSFYNSEKEQTSRYAPLSSIFECSRGYESYFRFSIGHKTDDSSELSILGDYLESITFPCDEGIVMPKLIPGFITNVRRYDTSKVSTTLINAIDHDIEVICTDDIQIRGLSVFDSDKKYSGYTTVSNKKTTLNKGFYYSVVLEKTDQSDVTVDDAYGKVFVDDEAIIINAIEEIKSDISNIIDDVQEVGMDVSEAKWYMCQTIGEELSVIENSRYASVVIPITEGLKCYIEGCGGTAGRLWYTLDSENKTVRFPVKETTEDVIVANEGETTLIVQTNSKKAHPIAVRIVNEGRVSILENHVDFIEGNSFFKDAYEFKPKSANYTSKISRLLAGEDLFVNIVFIGDSWTQGVPSDGIQRTYAKNLARMLQDKYGYGGLGWIDFARDANNGTYGDMFGACDGYTNFSYSFAGTVTGLDGNNASDAPNCLGICCAHSIFAAGASLTLEFKPNILDRFKIRYYKNANFTVKINDETAVEVTANASDNWQETEFGGSTNITKVVITSLANDSIIFGMDCFYGTRGIRCHKVGNRSISAIRYLAMNEQQWEDGIKLLDSCWTSILLAINDVGTNQKTDDALKPVANNIMSLAERVETAYAENDIVTTDITLLGVDNIQASLYVSLGRLQEIVRPLAVSAGYGYINTKYVIGDSKTVFDTYNLFMDRINLGEAGSKIYANHIFNTLLNVGTKEDSIWHPCKWLALGDSITEGYYSYLDANSEPAYRNDSTHTYVTALAKMKDWLLTNRAIGGTGWYCKGPNNRQNAREVVDTLTSEYLSQFSVCTLMYGINDYKWGKGEIIYGTMEDDVESTTSVIANIKYVIENLQKKAPFMKIIVITPLNAVGYDFNLGDESTNFALGYGINVYIHDGDSVLVKKTLQDYVDTIKEVCNYYDIEYIDMSKTSIVNRCNLTNHLLDGVHPSERTHQIIARELDKKICF